MAQTSPRSCPNCGTSLAEEQRFCSNCGALAENETSNPTVPGGETPTASEMSTLASASPSDSPYAQYQQMQPPPPPSYEPTLPIYQPSSPPAYATPQRGSSSRTLRNVGWGVTIVVLLVLVLCGTAGYFVYNSIKSATNNVSRSQQAAPTADTTGAAAVTNVTPTTGSTTTSPVNAVITYAGVELTIDDVKQAQSFADDDSSSQNGVARLDIKENNTSTTSPSYLYSDAVRLLLPDGSKVAPINTEHPISPDASIARTNWLDFPVPTTVKANQLILRFGKESEAQMDMPLVGNADLSKYKSKTANPNKQTQYAGLNWTLKTAVSSWSSNGKQADKGMIYVTVTLRVDNPSQNEFSAYWGDYMRLKAGDATSSPESGTNFPTSFAAGSSGTMGSVVFLVPQGNTTYTLILLGNTSSQVGPASLGFQIQ